MTNIAMSISDSEAGARKVGTYDLPDDRSKGSPPPPRQTPPERPRRSLSWLWWLIGLIVLLAIAWWAYTALRGNSGSTVPPAVTPVATPAAAAPQASLSARLPVCLYAVGQA